MKGKSITSFLLAFLAFSLTCHAGTLVIFNIYTNGSLNPPVEVDVQLYDQDKPITVNNFLSLIEAGAYTNGFFHRCEPHFVLQGGGYGTFNPKLTNVIAPPYTNVFATGSFGPITNEFHVGRFYSNVYGTIAMAKTSDPNSATSQFFFNLTNNSTSLDNTNNSGGFTVFGKVVRGTNYLNHFNTLSLNHGIVNLENNYGVDGSYFTELPKTGTGSNAPPYQHLVYYSMSILTTHVKLVSGGVRQISWTSVKGVTNLVEYATNMPPAWHTLIKTNGNGSTFTVTDSSANKTGRYYRVRVLF